MTNKEIFADSVQADAVPTKGNELSYPHRAVKPASVRNNVPAKVDRPSPTEWR